MNKLLNHQITPELMEYRGFEVKKLYAWVEADGTLVCKPSDDYEKLLSKKEEIERIVSKRKCSIGKSIRLIEFENKETKLKLNPPLPANHKKRTFGGHAIGGASVHTADDLLREFKRIFKKQYPVEPEFKVEEKTVKAVYNGISCWVTMLDPTTAPINVEYNLKKTWEAIANNQNAWGEDHVPRSLGCFYCGLDAVEAAFLGFVELQIQRQDIDDLF